VEKILEKSPEKVYNGPKNFVSIFSDDVFAFPTLFRQKYLFFRLRHMEGGTFCTKFGYLN